jgi:hypothetical protein
LLDVPHPLPPSSFSVIHLINIYWAPGSIAGKIAENQPDINSHPNGTSVFMQETV